MKLVKAVVRVHGHLVSGRNRLFIYKSGTAGVPGVSGASGVPCVSGVSGVHSVPGVSACLVCMVSWKSKTNI